MNNIKGNQKMGYIRSKMYWKMKKETEKNKM